MWARCSNRTCVCVCMPAMMFRKQWVREPCPFWFGLLHFDQIGYVVYLQYFIFLLLLLLLLFVNAERNEHNQTKRTEKSELMEASVRWDFFLDIFFFVPFISIFKKNIIAIKIIVPYRSVIILLYSPFLNVRRPSHDQQSKIMFYW